MDKKGAVITGGGSGINLAFAKAIRAKGYTVVVGDIALHHEASEWLLTTDKDGGPTVVFEHTDVIVLAQLERLFDVFAERIGGVPNIIVAGAGVYEASTAGFWNDEDLDSHYKVLDINLVHPIQLTRIAIRRLRRANKPGVILHESSIVALEPSVVLPLYASSKAGLSHFVRSMAQLEEMAGIKVVAVAPGIVDTPLFRDHPQALDQIDITTDFLLPPDEVVRAMLALVLDSKYRGGTVLEVNDIGSWREVQLLNDPGPQGRSKLPRAKAAGAITLVENALARDGGAYKE
ncbi:hypothetical protein LTR86_009309 [Recurvomyces mirabilis]|nr:hypothetical protein LTR86_009309 [Recurvomyces mirabilis]